MPECGKRVGTGVVTYPCTIEVDASGTHEGPCAATELPASQRKRQQWSAEQRAQPAAFPAEFKEDPTRGRGVVARMVHPTPQAEGAEPEPKPLAGRRIPKGSLGPPRGQVCQACQGEGSVALTGIWAHIGTGRAICTACEGRGMPPVTPSPTSTPTPAPTKTREGDQPLPEVHHGEPNVQDAVIADIAARREVGIERYGTPLQVFNGRDSLLDVYEESLDLTVYLKQLFLERAEGAEALGIIEAWLTEQGVLVPTEVGHAILTLSAVLRV